MPRTIKEIVAHIRAACGDPSVAATLIQTEDLLALCDQIEMPVPLPREVPPLVQPMLEPKPNWKIQPFEYYAAHFLVGSGLVHGNLYGNAKALADAMKKQYDAGVEHGRNAPTEVVAR